MPTLLDVRRLSLKTKSGSYLLKNIGFTLNPGEIIGIVGSSGCGKSTLAKTLLQLNDSKELHSAEGEALFKGEDLLKMPSRTMRHVRGREIAIVFQEAQSALNPLMTIGKQISESLKQTGAFTGRELKEHVLELLDTVGLSGKAMISAYPHEMSGGMRQRALIAIAIAQKPDLLLLDEPTTALDATHKARILDLLSGLNEARGIAMIFISHNLLEVAALCHRVLVMDQGEIKEEGSWEAIQSAPKSRAAQELIFYLQ